MPSEVPCGAIFLGVPVHNEFGADEEEGRLISLLSVDSISGNGFSNAKSLQESYNSSGFIFGLRSGFTFQLLFGIIVLWGFNEHVSSILESPAHIGFLTLVWSAVTLIAAIVSSQLFAHWNGLQSMQQSLQQEFHLFHGNLIGMFLSWVIFDIVLAMGAPILCLHSGVALIGHIFIQRSKKNLF